MRRHNWIYSIGSIVGILLCLWLIIGCGVGWKTYTIEQISQVLYDEGLITSTNFSVIEYPGGTKAYNFVGDYTLTLTKHYGSVAIYSSQSEVNRATRDFAESMAGRGREHVYSEFVKGNVVITIFPELSEIDADRFRQALDTLE